MVACVAGALVLSGASAWAAQGLDLNGQSSSGKQPQPPKGQPKPVKPPKPPKPPEKPDPRKWDLEFHYNFGFGETSNAGTGELPGAGEAFTTSGGSQTRRVPSWFFGDGSQLFNDVLASLGRVEKIVPADPVITRPAVSTELDRAIGGRLTRKLKPAMSLEMGVEVSQATFTVLDETKDGLEAAAGGFPAGFAGLVASGQGVAFTNASITSSYGWGDGTGVDLMATGALLFHSKKDSRIRPYVAVGAGFATAFGEAIGSLSGHYRFQLPSGGVVDETDNVTIHFRGGLGLVGLGGFGINWRFTRGSGLRFDARVLMIENHMETVVETHPSAVYSIPADAIWSGLTPGIQFITDPSTGLVSNLNTSGLSDFTTLHGSRFHTRYNVTVGYFWRF